MNQLTPLAAAVALALQLPAHAQAPAAPTSTLSTVTVRETAGPASATTENSGSFTANSSSLFKGEQSIRATPQPVTVITRQLMDDRQLLDFHDVMQNTPGVFVDYTDSERVNFNSRGYQIDQLLIDGLPVSQGGSIFVQPDTAVLDRVEVLRGASGMLRGSGNPSGAVNLVRKRPTAGFQGEAAVTFGSWNRRRVEGDISAPLNHAGTVRARVVAVADQKDFFQKVRAEDRKVLYGVIEADLTPRTRLSASLQHTDLDATGAWGNIPANLDGSALGLPRDTYLGANWNQWNRYNQQAHAELEHAFDNGWKLRLNGSQTRFRMKDMGFKQSYFARPAGVTNPYLMDVTSSVYTGDASDQRALNATANGPFSLLGRKHELVFGADTQRVKTTPTVGVGNLNPRRVDIRTWDPASYPEPFPAITAVPVVNETEQKGAYATAKLSLADPLTAHVGARASWWKYSVPSQPASTANYSVNREITPYVGLVWDFANDWSAYASYTEIFTPQNVLGTAGQILDPIRGEDYEAGVKGEFFGGKLNTQLSVFRINNVGKAVEDTSTRNPCTPYFTTGFCRVAGGKTRSQGVELEVSGEIRPGWQAHAGYTFTRTRYIVDTAAANVGQPLRSLDPKHQLRLFTSYRLGGALQGWTVGGGANVQSDSYVTSGALTARQGGYTTVDALVGYRFNKQYAVQLNVNNIFDKVYFRKYQPVGIGNYYGDPRNVMVSLRASF